MIPRSQQAVALLAWIRLSNPELWQQIKEFAEKERILWAVAFLPILTTEPVSTTPPEE